VWAVGVLCAAAVVYGIGFVAVAPIAKAKIEQLCGGAAAVQSGWFTVLGEVRLKGLVVATDAQSPKESAVLRADRLDVRFDPWDLFKGRLTIHSVTMADFLLTADYESARGGWNLSRLTFGNTPRPPQAAFPLIQVRRGAVRLRWLSQGTPQTLATFSLNGTVAKQTGRNEYGFTLETDERFGFEGSRLQGVLTLGQEDRQSRFAAAGQIRMPQARVLDNAWNMENIRLECTFDSQTISIQRLGFSMGTGRADISGLIHLTGRRPMDLKISTQGLAISDHFIPDTIVCSAPVQMVLDSGLSRFLGQYHVCGQGDLEVTIRGHLDDLSDTGIDGVIHCRDITVTDEKFPYAITGIQGPIELTGRRLRLNNLQGRHGDVALLIDGTVDNFGPQAVIELRTTSDNMRFDDDLYNALNASMKKMWFAFTPRGLTGVDYQFRRAADGQKEIRLALDLNGASAVYQYFPYPLENLTGTIVIKPGQVEFNEVVSHYEDGRSVVLNGRTAGIKPAESAFDIRVQGRHIPVDQRLIQSMPKEQRALFDRLQIEATADLDVHFFPSQTAERLLDYSARIRLDGPRLLYEGFPLEIRDVHLSADISPDAAVLNRFEGQTESGAVTLSGKLYPSGTQPERPGFCLELDLKAFDLNDDFWQAAGPQAEQTLTKIRLAGKVNAIGHLEVNLPQDLCKGSDLVIDCSDNPVMWNGALLGQADGRLHFQNEQVRFEEFQLQNIPVASLPLDIMSDRIQMLYAWAHPEGQARILIHHGQVQMQPQGPSWMEMDAEVELIGVSCGKTERIRQLDGVFDGYLAGDFRRRRWDMQTYYHIDHFLYRDRSVTGLNGQAAYDPDVMQLSSRNMTARLYEGTVKGEFQVNFDPQVQTGYTLKLDCEQVNVQKFLEAQQPTDPQRQTQGLVSGTIGLEGDFKNLAEPRGRLTAEVADMKMGQQSLPGKILTAVQLRRPEEFVFSRMKVDAAVQGSQLILEDVLMVGDPLVFRGKGRLDMANRRITMELMASNRLAGKEDTLLDQLLRGLGGALWRVEIRGDLKEPDIQAVFLSVFKPPMGIF
jgi:hypothetical protein